MSVCALCYFYLFLFILFMFIWVIHLTLFAKMYPQTALTTPWLRDLPVTCAHGMGLSSRVHVNTKPSNKVRKISKRPSSKVNHWSLIWHWKLKSSWEEVSVKDNLPSPALTSGSQKRQPADTCIGQFLGHVPSPALTNRLGFSECVTICICAKSSDLDNYTVQKVSHLTNNWFVA